MPDLIRDALATEGIWWLVAAIIAAGMVRGFSGFGSAMIIMPAASSVLSPFAAITFLIIVELAGPLPNLPNALRNGSIPETARLLLGAAVALPLGLWALTQIEPVVFGWIVSGMVLVLLLVLLTGWRYAGPMHPPVVFGTGALGGFLSGLTGMPGPPVIMLYMASTKPIAMIRANFLLYLLGIDIMLITIFWFMDRLAVVPVIIGLMLIPVYILSNIAGARFFDPQAESRFRAVSYAIIAASALLGLPLWKG